MWVAFGRNHGKLTGGKQCAPQLKLSTTQICIRVSAERSLSNRTTTLITLPVIAVLRSQVRQKHSKLLIFEVFWRLKRWEGVIQPVFCRHELRRTDSMHACFPWIIWRHTWMPLATIQICLLNIILIIKTVWISVTSPADSGRKL